MIKVYTGELLSDVPRTEILYPNLGNDERETPFGEKIFENWKEGGEKIVEIVDAPEKADYLCIPHNYNYIKNRGQYVWNFVQISEKFSKKIIVFLPGDSDDNIDIPSSIIFRNSQYKHKLKDNEIIMPAYAVDLGKKYGLIERIKGTRPIVSFCGWASYKTVREWLSYGIFNLMESLVGKPVRKKGLYFRRIALAILENSPLIEANFIIRNSYSGHPKTISIDPTAARKEYVENIQKADFTLAPKGDGNFSVRFFESLSLGRVPLLIDTDCPLPLEDEINYDEFILRVNHSKMHELPQIVKKYYDELGAESYLLKQKRCREVFEKYLRIEVFLKHTFTKEFLQ
jgi:hypothetical protein